jgi:hypothetical protein
VQEIASGGVHLLNVTHGNGTVSGTFSGEAGVTPLEQRVYPCTSAAEGAVGGSQQAVAGLPRVGVRGGEVSDPMVFTARLTSSVLDR